MELANLCMRWVSQYSHRVVFWIWRGSVCPLNSVSHEHYTFPLWGMFSIDLNYERLETRRRPAERQFVLGHNLHIVCLPPP